MSQAQLLAAKGSSSNWTALSPGNNRASRSDVKSWKGKKFPKGPSEQPKPKDLELIPEVLARENELIATRRQLHMYPELKFEEVETAALVAGRLRAAGIEVTEQVGITGVVGVLRGGFPGPCIALRGDMDALPLQENNELEYKSRIDGVMHACGHDAHVAMLLTAAEVLADERENIHGIVKFIFQPAEEGGGGAVEMIRDGVLENPRVDEIYGAHIRGGRETYEMEVAFGPAAAASDSWRIVIEGSGGHGARPEETQDVILAGSELTSQINTIIPRNIKALDSAVLSVCKFDSGTTYNIIPAEATLLGTLRTFDLDVRSRIVERMQQIVRGVSESFEVSASLAFEGIGYPPVRNDYKEQYEKAIEACTDVLGPEGIFADEPAHMASEDFSFFLNERPGCFFRLGSSDIPPPGYNQHSPDFYLDERCLAVGASVWVRLIRNLLGGQTSTAPQTKKAREIDVKNGAKTTRDIINVKPIMSKESDSSSSTTTTAEVDGSVSCSLESCGKKMSGDSDSLKCGVCRKTVYCSRDCQKAHWQAGHKQTCKKTKMW